MKEGTFQKQIGITSQSITSCLGWMECSSDESELLSSTSPQEGSEKIIPSLVEQDLTQHHSSHRYGPCCFGATESHTQLSHAACSPYWWTISPVSYRPSEASPGGLGQSGCVCISVSPGHLDCNQRAAWARWAAVAFLITSTPCGRSGEHWRIWMLEQRLWSFLGFFKWQHSVKQLCRLSYHNQACVNNLGATHTYCSWRCHSTT